MSHQRESHFKEHTLLKLFSAQETQAHFPKAVMLKVLTKPELSLLHLKTKIKWKTFQ